MKRAVYIILIFIFILLFMSCNSVEIKSENVNNNINNNINGEIVSEKEPLQSENELLIESSQQDLNSAVGRAVSEQPIDSKSTPILLYVLIFLIGVPIFIIGIWVLYRIIQAQRNRYKD